MKKMYLFALIFLFISTPAIYAQEEGSHPKQEDPLKRHKIGAFLGNAVIHGVHNANTGHEQYVIAPTFGIDYEYWISHKWAIGSYNEIAHVDIEVETDDHEEYIKRENAMLFSGVVIYEPVHRLSTFAGTGVETDPHHTFWIWYMGLEYAFIRCNDWDVSVSGGYVNKDSYDGFTFGVVIGRRFGKNIPSKHHK